ncbi:MAG: penicillin-binding protein activator LpoB [bacterium]|nr:penicillin-binding protein activator LpoB [Gemmatimonadota bacterium]
MRARSLTLVLAMITLLPACGGKTITRVDPNEAIDLSGRWNDTDSRYVAEALISDCMNAPWLSRHMNASSQRPVVVVGPVRNKAMEHIPVDTFINEMERAFINDGRVRVVADAGERVDIRAERESMQGNTTMESLKRFGKELGADYVLAGEVNQINDQEGGEKVAFFRTDLELINVESNEKVWFGTHQIKKFIARGRYSG